MVNNLSNGARGVMMVVSACLLAACSGNSPTTSNAPDTTTTNTVAVAVGNASSNSTSPPPTPAATSTSSDVVAVDSKGAAPIADNFGASIGIEATNYGPNGTGGIPLESADPVGAFRFICLAGQVLNDDPVVLPGQPGKAHLHAFIGNTAANANSTYQSLRTSGGSTCDNRGQPYALNRSSYWMPAMLDGAGNAVLADFVLVYYKQIPTGNPACGAPDATHVGFCVQIPNGIRFIFGYNMATNSGGPADLNSIESGTEAFACADRDGGATKGAAVGTHRNIADVVAAGCPANAWLWIGLQAPNCWDGKNLDSSDHRSHVVYGTGEFIAAVQMRACPADHPYLIPFISYQWQYTTDDNFVAGKWHLSSDEMLAKMTGKPVVPGTTLHMDYFEAWSPAVKAIWHQNCIDKHLTCNNGDLGNGTMMKDAGHVDGPWPSHGLVSGVRAF